MSHLFECFRFLALAIVLAYHNDILSTCTDGMLLRVYYIGMMALLCVAVVLSMLTAYISSKGTIVDTSERRYLSVFLYIRLFLCIPDIVWTALGSQWAFQEMHCDAIAVAVIRTAVVVGWLLVLALIIGIAVVFDPLGHHHSGSGSQQEHERLWTLR